MRNFKKIGSRKGLNDMLKYNGSLTTIDKIIKHDPLTLWQLVYGKRYKVSLNKPAYYKLKAEIFKYYPEEIDKLEFRKRIYKQLNG